MNSPATELIARMQVTLREWEAEELRNDWWSYQRDHADAVGILQELIGSLCDSGSHRDGEDPQGLSAEGMAERPAKTGIAQP